MSSGPRAVAMRMTPRQAQIVDLVADGLSDKQIAAQLGLAQNTVRTHLQRLFRDCGLHNRAEAAARWIQLRDAELQARAPSPPVVPPRPAPGRSRQPARLVGSLLLIAASVTVVIFALSSRTAPAASARLTQTIAPVSTSVQASSRVTTDTRRSFVVSVPALALRRMLATTVLPQPSPFRVLTPAAPLPSLVSTRLAFEQLNLVNGDRSAAGLAPLRWSDCLAELAAQAAKRLAEQGYASGSNEAGSWCGAASKALNVADWSSTDDGRLNAIFLASPIQRANLLGPYARTGAAWATAASGISFLVVVFA
jgi:DNA-binding CsgD family transcriptional regulator/uncharacterized protein YkwD